MNEYIEESKNKRSKDRDITFHYTPELLVKHLIDNTPIKEGDVVLDAGSGKNKVFYNNISDNCIAKECELEDGVDFLTQWNEKVDWTIGNPPFDIGWKFIEKAMQISNKGIAFLGNINFLNSLTPTRLKILQENGFNISHIEIVKVKKWYGRYYWIIFTKENNNFIGYCDFNF